MKILSVIIACLLCSQMWAQQIAITPSIKGNHSFAIFADKATYNACKGEIEAYKDVIEKDGLPTFIFAEDWKNPEQVRDIIREQYRKSGLEGVVFVGDIPIAMIRGAQHFTSAFKMDQEKFPMYDSSVPSDRYYDDFDLKFRFIQQDSAHHHLFYYWLTGDSKQSIMSDIYSARIRSTKSGEEGFNQIRGYLKKIVAERAKENPLDCLVSYTGHGSFSNSLNAWKDEAVTLREQIPAAFKSAENAKFFIFFMEPYMKNTLIKELKRDEVDLFFFHEHGMTERQYLTGSPLSEGEDQLIANAKFFVRQYWRRASRYKSFDPEKIKSNLMAKYGIDSTWFEGINDPETIKADSLEDLKTGIIVEEVGEIAPNARLVVFDACYNGDFRNGDFISGEYIFSKGKTIACWANSVNVLQDKSSSDLLGMLSYGARVGEWAKNINILESHIIGDPTYRFAAPKDAVKIDYHSKDCSYWLEIANGNYPYDIQSLALYKLYYLEYEGLSALLYKRYCDSPSYMQRLQCMTLLAHYNNEDYVNLLKRASKDPYEFIRRKGAYYMSHVGRNDLLPYMVKLMMHDYLNERVKFNVMNNINHFSMPLAKILFDEAIEKSNFIFDKKEFKASVDKSLNYEEHLFAETLRCVVDKSLSEKARGFYISSLRNNPYAVAAPDILVALGDSENSSAYRIRLAEALGWFVRAHNRAMIIESCQNILNNEKDMPAELADEITKTINRLKEYNRK